MNVTVKEIVSISIMYPIICNHWQQGAAQGDNDREWIIFNLR